MSISVDQDASLREPVLRKLIDPFICTVCAESSSAVAESSSAADAFCCTTLLSCWIALFICWMPLACSPLAALISGTSSAVFWMSGTSLASISPAFSAMPTLEPVSSLISLAAFCDLSASFCTSLATTAKPFRRLDHTVARFLDDIFHRLSYRSRIIDDENLLCHNPSMLRPFIFILQTQLHP